MKIFRVSPPTEKKRTFFQRHGLTIITSTILARWVVLYSASNENTHVSSFVRNAIADWTGVVVMVLATKFLYEQGSKESKSSGKKWHNRLLETLREHSLTIFLLLTGAGCVWLFGHGDSESKWGQVAGNIVSEWTQILGI